MARRRLRRMRQAASRTAETKQPTTGERENPRFYEAGGEFGIPGGGVRSRVREERQRLRGEGVRGRELRSSIRDFRGGARDAADEDARAGLERMGLSDEQMSTIQNPRKFLRRTLGGGRWGRLMQEDIFRGSRETPSETALESHLLGSLEGEGGAPGHSAFDERIAQMNADGMGLTPQEWNTYQRQGMQATEGAVGQAGANLAQRNAASGIDPRSPLAGDQSLKLSAMRMAGRTGVADELRRLDLQRKKDWEGYGMSRLGGVEGRLAGMAGLDENQYQYDRDMVEGRKQSNLARKAMEAAAEEAMPSTGDKVIGGLGGFFGGLTGGGGGGGI